MRKKILTVTLALGVLLFGFLIYKAGPAQILDRIKALSWKSFLIPMPLRLKAVFAGFVGLMLALCLVLLAKQRQGFFIWMVKALGKIRIRFRFVERNMDKIREIDSYISSFYREHRAKIPLVALLYSVTFLFWAVEIHMTLLFLHVPGLTFVKSLFVITLGNIALLVPTVPASLGVYEITNIGVFALLGWGAAIALSMAIIRRVLMLLWTGIGLLIMAKHQIKP